EERRRQRYAVIAALGRNGLVPQNDQSVGFLETRWTGEGTLLAGPEDEDDPPHISIDVPFEWYSESLDDKTFIQQHKTDHTQLKQENIPAGQRRQEVLVLWLNESQFGQRPLSMVSQLFDKLFEHYGTNPFTGDRIRLAVIGPATSTSLEALLEEIAAKARDMPETDSKAKDKKDSIEPTEQYFPDLSDDHRQLVEFFDFYLDEAVPATPEELVVAETLIKQRLDKVSSSKYERSDVWAAALLSAETDLRDSLSKLAWVNKVEDIDSNWLQTTLSLWRIARLELLPAQGSYRLANHLVEILSLEEPIAFHSETDSAALQTSIAAAIAEFRPEVWYVKEKEAFLNSILKTLRSNASLTEMNLEAAVDFWSDEAIPWSMGLPVDSTSYLEFISSRATIWPRLMSKEAQQALTLMENEKGSNGGSKHTETVSFELPKFSRTISNDRQLIAMLLSEFSDRSMHFGSLDEGSRDHVALIGEWDTHYGRAFPATFRAALCEQFNTSLEDSKKSDKKETQEGQRQPLVCTNPDLLASEFDNIHQFQYLRGIDGLIPGDEPKESEKSEKRQESARIDVAVLQRPDGRSQLDYIGRLCDQISTR
ncbi:MAG: hypothetical protein GY906_06655, partial [bacterium]|nr:hypothetical protein [bacterium]